jgi:hypothetical protein
VLGRLESPQLWALPLTSPSMFTLVRNIGPRTTWNLGSTCAAISSPVSALISTTLTSQSQQCSLFFPPGTLPWLDSHKDWMADYKIFCKSSGRQHLVSQLPSQFDSILDIIHRSNDTVDYYKISALLRSAIAQQGQRTVEEQCAWKVNPSKSQSLQAVQITFTFPHLSQRDPSIIARALELPTQY